MSVVYALQVETSGPIKIGCTAVTGVVGRMQMIQSASPWALRCIGVWSGAREDEQSAHRALRAFQLRNEWFHPVKPVCDYIGARCPEFGLDKYLETVFRVSKRKEIQKSFGPRHHGARPLVEKAMGCDGRAFYEWTSCARILPDDVIDRGVQAARDIISGKIPTITNYRWRAMWREEHASAQAENRHVNANRLDRSVEAARSLKGHAPEIDRVAS